VNAKRIGRQLLRSPAETLLLVRMAFWAAGAPLLKRLLPLPRLVRLFASSREPGARDRGREQRVIAGVVRLYRSGLIRQGDNCLERSLVTYRYLGAVHADPELVVGMSRLEKGAGHVWVTVDGNPVHDTAETLDGMERVVAFAADGARIED
jgi:Transglutaminase-like superfamily